MRDRLVGAYRAIGDFGDFAGGLAAMVGIAASIGGAPLAVVAIWLQLPLQWQVAAALLGVIAAAILALVALVALAMLRRPALPAGIRRSRITLYLHDYRDDGQV